MGEKKPAVTIVTPTFNRADLLNRCYNSLCAQTSKDFEWIIVDDGSSDDTELVVSKFQAQEFSIIYVKKENGGKHTALNASHPYISGEYVLILDSDDFLLENAVESVCRKWETFRSNPDVGVVIFLRGKNKHTANCTVDIFNKPIDILRHKKNRGYGTDCCEVVRTDLFLKYPFPVYPNEKFVAECALWNRIAQTHKCVYIDEIIYICEYLEGGLSDSGRKMRMKNPLGGMFTSELRMVKKNYFLQRIKYGMLYCCYGRFAGQKAKQIVKSAKYKTLTALCILPGWIMYCLWKEK